MSGEAELGTLDDSPSKSRPDTVGNRVFEALKLAIVQLRLRPGNPLSEAEVARQLGVSRQPVREAFIKLAEVGLVEVRPQRGTFVVMISISMVQNVRFVREAIEIAIARKAALEASPAAIAELERIIAQQRVMAAAGDHVGFLGLDEAFHQALAHGAGCDYAWTVLENMKAQMDRVRYLSMPNATPIETLIAQHEAVVEGISRHSPDEAEAAIRAHLSEILMSLPKLANSFPELFTS